MSLIKGFINGRECLETRNKHLFLGVSSKSHQLKAGLAKLLEEPASRLCSATCDLMDDLGQIPVLLPPHSPSRGAEIMPP